jgi:endonuclease I
MRHRGLAATTGLATIGLAVALPVLAAGPAAAQSGPLCPLLRIGVGPVHIGLGLGCPPPPHLPLPTTTTPPPPTTTTPPPTTTTTTSPTDTYYASALGKSGPALRSSLHSIIRNQTVLTYDQVWDALKDTDQDPANGNNVIEIYSGRSIAKSDHGGGVDQWNREHVWAKSHGDFGTANGPGTDVHHLRPEDVTVNSDRGNLDFDNGGSAVNQCSDCWRDGDSFEPRDAVKGDVARMVFYMAIRHEGDDGWPDLEPNNSVANGTAPAIGKLTVLKAWSAGDPPDAFEKRRNQVIYDTWQHNRNPFVDHPEWVSSIWP